MKDEKWEPQDYFAKMVNVAMGTMRSYLSDLYHDAIALKEYKGAFLWGCYELGTVFIRGDQPGSIELKKGAEKNHRITTWYAGNTAHGSEWKEVSL